MKKKILSFLIALTSVAGCIGGYSASAENNSRYDSTYEEIRNTGYIIKSRNLNDEITLETIGIDNSNGYYSMYPVQFTDGLELGYESYLSAHAYFGDETFSDFTKSDEITGYYFVSNNIDCEKLESDENIEEVYKLVCVLRNEFESGTECDMVVCSHYKAIKADEIIENDVNGDGEVNSEDALKLLNVLVGNDTLTIKEKINLGIYTSQLNPEYAEYKVGSVNDIKEPLSSDKALEILYQVVGE